MGGFGVVAQDIDWSIDDEKNWFGKNACPVDQRLGRADTEEVNGKKDGCPETPAKAAAARGTGGVGSAFDLVCGLFVHGESVGQEEGKIEDENENEDEDDSKGKENYGVSV
jgi:hypothetical protein